MPEYTCDECGETFPSQQHYASHAGRTGHDVAGTRRTAPLSRLKRMLPASKARFLTAFTPADPDDDGRYEIPRYSWWVGVLGLFVGHTIAHDPVLLDEFAVEILTLLSALVGASFPKRSPIRPEHLVGPSIRLFIVGLGLGILLVMSPISADDLAHGLGTHTHA